MSPIGWSSSSGRYHFNSRFQKSEDHASADDDLLALVKESVQDGDLRGDLGSTDDGGHGLLAVLDGAVKVLELLGEEEARHRGLEELGHSLSRGVGAVGSTEGVVHEHVEGSGELLNETSLVLGLLLVEAGVLQHDDISLAGGVDYGGDLVSDAVGGELHLLSEELSHAVSARSEGELILGSVLGSTKVRADGHDGALALEELDGGDRRADPGVIGDGLSVKRDVDVASDENLLALELSLGKILNAFLHLIVRSRKITVQGRDERERATFS